MFCDSEDVKFDPLEIHSQFNHVFVVVVPAGKSPAGKQLYRISIVRKFGVPAIEPKLTYPAVYEEGDIFREMFLTKLINSERLFLQPQGAQLVTTLLTSDLMRGQCQSDFKALYTLACPP